MSIRPNFTFAQVQELKQLHVCDEQIDELRMALIEVRRIMRKPPAVNDVRDLLNEVADLSSSLTDKLARIGAPAHAAHSAALGLIEVGYWQDERVRDDGSTSMHHLIPRLSALKQAALAGLEELPNNPTRHRTADPIPIEKIARALSYGWSKAHGSIVDSINTKPRAANHRLPQKFRPSRSPGCTFLRIAGICYAAVGYEHEPDAAIRNYMASEKLKKKKLIEGWKQAIKGANAS